MVLAFPIRITVALILMLSLVGVCAAVPAEAINDVYIGSRRMGVEVVLVLHNKNKSRAIRATVRFTPGCRDPWEEAVNVEAGGSRDLIKPTGLGSCLRPTTAKIVGATYY